MVGQDIFDVVIILVLTFFAIRGYLVGFVGEVAAIVSLVGGFWVAHTFHTLLAEKITFVSEPLWRNMAAYVILFVAVVIAVAIMARVLQRILSFAFVSWADKLAGGVMGLAKGLIVCSIAFVVLGQFCANADFYKNSRVRPYFSTFIDTVRSSLPQDVVQKFHI